MYVNACKLVSMVVSIDVSMHVSKGVSMYMFLCTYVNLWINEFINVSPTLFHISVVNNIIIVVPYNSPYTYN